MTAVVLAASTNNAVTQAPSDLLRIQLADTGQHGDLEVLAAFVEKSSTCSDVGTKANPISASGCHWKMEPPSPIQP